MPTEIPVSEARRIVLEKVAPLPAETVSLAEARDRVLAAPLVAPRSVPAWDYSSMDGYAVRAVDCTPAALLRMQEELPAGRAATGPLAVGGAIRINTGAP